MNIADGNEMNYAFPICPTSDKRIKIEHLISKRIRESRERVKIIFHGSFYGSVMGSIERERSGFWKEKKEGQNGHFG